MRLVSTLVLGLTLVAAHSFSQAIYTTDTSMVSFFSATPVENIEAFNTASTSMLNVSKKEIVFRVPIAGFKFEQALMEEHFNENYMESEKYPYATFTGKLSDSLNLSKDTIYSVTATGMMNVHGQDRMEAFSGFIVCKNGRAALTCDFAIALRNYNIKVPKVVFANIAEVIEVKTYFEFKAYEEK